MDAALDKIITIGGSNPRQVARTVLLLLLFGYASGRFSQSVFRHGLKRTVFYLGFLVWKAAKGNKGYAAEMSSVRKNFQHSLYHKAVTDIPINKALPKTSHPQREILAKLEEWAKYEENLWNGKKRMSSGAVYHGGKQLSALQNQAYSLFSIANPLHPDVFPFTRKMESEIIAMTLSYFHGNPHLQKGSVLLLYLSIDNEPVRRVQNVRFPIHFRFADIGRNREYLYGHKSVQKLGESN